METSPQHINQSITIQAPVNAVWEMLVTPECIRQWASAFSEGAMATSDWKKGSEVLWTDSTGTPGAKGKVLEIQQNQLLKVGFYDDAFAPSSAQLGKYTETYTLSASGNITILTIASGPLEPEHIQIHAPLWQKALLLLKQMAEKSR